MAESQDAYTYTAKGLAELETNISPRRFFTYLDHAQRNREGAVGWYLHNARLSKAIRFPLEVVEITIRNRTHMALTDRWGDNWPKSKGFRNAAAEKTLDRLKEVYAKYGENAAVDRVVASLSFGFWPVLYKDRYRETLWRGRLKEFYPHLPSEKSLEDNLADMDRILGLALEVRNRIGHLEPIFKRALSPEHTEFLTLVGYACRTTSGWLRQHSTLRLSCERGRSSCASRSFFERRTSPSARSRRRLL
jgi:hypothetical protein